MIITMYSKIVWLQDYTEGDIDPFAKILDLGLPFPYGFVISRSVLHSVYLNLAVQEKLIPLFEYSHEDSSGELAHVQDLIQQIFHNIHIPKDFAHRVNSAYEHLLEKEKYYLKLHVSDLHRAANILRHIYSPPVVRMSFLPHSSSTSFCAGESSLIDSVTQMAVSHLKGNIAKERSIELPSILVQRVPNGQYSGYCETLNKVRHNSNQMVIYGNLGAQILDEAGDLYIIDKDSVTITDRHIQTQPYKYVLKGTGYKKVAIHEEDGNRQILPDSLILKISYLCKDIERKLYFPQKIYWTLENGLLYVTRLKQI